jgi:hypothetical protein
MVMLLSGLSRAFPRASSASRGSAAQALTLTNTGTAPLVIGRLALAGANPGDYQIVQDSGGSPLAPGASRALTLRFTPQALGSRAARLTITDNAAGGQQTIGLSGSGSLPVAGHRGLSCPPAPSFRSSRSTARRSRPAAKRSSRWASPCR